MISRTARATPVLLVGYDVPTSAALASALAGLGRAATSVATEEEAIATLRHHKIDCGLLDVTSPALGGLDSLERIARAEPEMALVVASPGNDPELAAACLQRGALDYVRLPADPSRLDAALRGARERQAAAARQADGERILREELARLTVRLRRARAGASRFSLQALESLVYMMEVRDPFLAGHSTRVAQLAATMAAELGRSEEEVEQVRVAGRLHDVGMLCIGDGILSKTGPLTEQEFNRVQQHVVIADQLLAQLPGLGGLRSFIRHHHERWDGRGYPDALSGEAIPWGSRLIGAAEIFDALTTARPYKEPVSPDQAIAKMGELSGTSVSPEAFEALAKVVERGKALVFIPPEDGSQLVALESDAFGVGFGGGGRRPR